MEVWDLYDKNGHKIDKTMIRGHKIPEGTYHLVVHIMIMNSKGDFLVQKRAKEKDLLPGIWAFTGGSATSGEDSHTAALRELSEETGIDLQAEDLFHKVRMLRGSSIADIWYGYLDVDVETLEFQKEEVSALAFMSKDKVIEMINEGSFHKYDEKYLDEVFNI